MKKRFLFSFILLFCLLFIISCAKVTGEMLLKNCSEIRYNLYVQEANGMHVSFMSGKREKEYQIDGYFTELIEFGVVTFDTGIDVKNIDYSYKLIIDNNEYDGSLEQNPFDGTLVADIKKIVNTLSDIKATLYLGDELYNFNLKLVSNSWNINYEDALNIASEHLGSKINKLIVKENLSAEVYVKIIHEKRISDSEFYWYINIVGRDKENYIVVLDTNSGNILAKNLY